jgi:hypothetical protein
MRFVIADREAVCGDLPAVRGEPDGRLRVACPLSGSGVEGLFDRSRAPLNHPHAVVQEAAERYLAVRRAYPTWGPVKVPAYLERPAPPGDDGGARHASGKRLRAAHAAGQNEAAGKRAAERRSAIHMKISWAPWMTPLRPDVLPIARGQTSPADQPHACNL